MATYFISDLHITEERPDITASLEYFLSSIATDANKLYILGDLFEFWIGDDNDSPMNLLVAKMLRDFSEKGVDIYHVFGNRDFMLKKRYADSAHMTLLSEHELIDLYGQKTLILHGDTLCTEDLAYQEFRRKMQRPWSQKLYLSLPLFVRQFIADKVRASSNKRKQNKQTTIMDVTPSEVIREFKENHLSLMIHGHTHRPAIHPIDIDGEIKQRVVLGAWYDEISYLKITPDSLALESQPLRTAKEN